MSKTITTIIKEINSLIDEIKQLSINADSDPNKLTVKMADLASKIDEMRTFPDGEWQKVRNDLLGLSANFDTMQQTLNTEYDKAKQELTQLRQRTQAQKSYAAYDNDPDGDK